MLVKKGNRFELYPHKVKYTQHGKEIEQWALPSKEWWIDFAQRWDHTEIIEFYEVKLTEEQLKRFEETNQFDIPDSFASQCVDYIFDNRFPEGVLHPLHSLQMLKQQEEQDLFLIDQDFRLSLFEMGGW